MRNLLLETGIDTDKVHVIPIGVELERFPLRTRDDRMTVRKVLGIPAEATVIGSFQKDGSGWGDGQEPKWIKGPDIFLRVLERLRPDCPRLHVLLTGPSRGYVKTGLARLGIPCTHVQMARYADMTGAYHALDLMLVCSREEGGPKAVLESLACGVPLVTTRVGQAADLVRHKVNGWIAEAEDVEALARWSLEALQAEDDTLLPLIAEGRRTAEANSRAQQLPLWQRFFERLLTCSPR